MTEINYTGIHHVTLLVANLTKSLDFYCNILNFIQRDDRPDLGFEGAWLSVGDSQQIHLMVLPNPDPVDGRPTHGGRDRHAAFSIRFILALQHRLDQHNIPYTMSKSGRSALFTRDPDGNALEFIEESS